MNIKNKIHKAIMDKNLHDLLDAVEQGWNVDEPDKLGRTALFYAAQDGDLELANALLECGANVNARDKKFETPLYFAIRSFQPEMVRNLIENGGAVNARDIEGNSPLLEAVFESKGRGQIIEMLLSFGADKNQKNKHGVSPVDLAGSIANYNLMPFLENHG